MGKLWKFGAIFVGLVLCFLSTPVYSQMDNSHGDQAYSTFGIHSGNQLRTTFWNDGQIGRRKNLTSIPQYGGEWPINSGHVILAKIATWFGSEVIDTQSQLRHIVSESNGTWTGDPNQLSSGDADRDTGDWWTMTPLPGFYNQNPDPEDSEYPWVAMSHKDWSWPIVWPDKMVDPGDPGWSGEWNGYFGKDKFNADQESFYIMDDWHNREFSFYPDSTDSTRRGLGFRVTVRGFQWAHPMVEDMLFWLFDVENIGTHLHDKVVFGVMSGPDIGSEGDSDDDGGAFNLLLDLGYQYDADNVGYQGYTPVEYLGLAFLESPGNPYDGIDNDGDARETAGPVLPEDVNSFATRNVNTGDDIVLINYNTFERTVSTMPAEGVTINYLGRDYVFMPGELVEVENNLIDDNLNGLIDENNGSIYGEGASAIDRRLYAGLKYVDYFTGDGEDNVLIDERRDDGIDNDGDWNILFDDVGLDGVAETGDEGEGDGMPTSGAGTGRPGEPHIDLTDVDESDQIGLTSFFIYSDGAAYSLSDDDALWEATTPGVLNAVGQIANTDVILGSGYFPVVPGTKERFSFAYMYGYPLDDLVRNKDQAQTAYAANYQFAKAPLVPTVQAFAEDGKVTLYWDDVAEGSFDELTGYDFEGYRIYRSTDQEWKDMDIITDGYGSVGSNRKPLAQFDLDNGISGFSSGLNNGTAFYLGDDTGLQHSFVDATVKNGFTYYYAVTSYDRGIDSTALYPSECTKYIAVNADGTIEKGKNVAVVRPEAPVAGFTDSKIEQTWLEGSTTNAEVIFSMIDKSIIEENTYRIVFKDRLVRDGQFDFPTTDNFSLIDLTSSSAPDTLLKNSTNFGSLVLIPGNNVFNFVLNNKDKIALNENESAWSNSNVYDFNFATGFVRSGGVRLYTTPMAHDYKIEFGDVGIGQSTAYLDFEAVDVNFKVTNTSFNKDVKFLFDERDGNDGVFSAYTEGSLSDRVFLFEEDSNDSLVMTWRFELSNPNNDSIKVNPQAGDYVDIVLDKPFLSHDVLEFKTIPAKVDNKKAKSDLDNIRVVPNPYIVGNSWEPKNLYTTGRGPHQLHFTHLPKKCTIRIINVRGQLVDTIEHDSDIWDGTAIWDMYTKDKLDIAFGVYIFHVDAPGIGEKIGKFAIIK